MSWNEEGSSHFYKTALVPTIYIVGLAFVVFILKNPLGASPQTLLFTLILVSLFSLRECWQHIHIDDSIKSLPWWTWHTIPATLFQLIALMSFAIPELRQDHQFEFVNVFISQIIVMLPPIIHGWIFFSKKEKSLE